MKVQVLLSTYNGEKFLQQQVESILNQKGVDVSLLVRDDGSTDNTKSLLQSLKGRYENRMEIFSATNVGVTQSFFELLKMSDVTSDFFAFADQDDVWFDIKLQTACQHIQENPKASQPFLYVGNYTPVDSNLRVIEAANEINRDVDYGMTLVENIALGCTMVMNRELRNEIVRCDIPPAIIHDWYIYLLAQTIGAVYVDREPTMFYRQHENNVIGNRSQGVGASFKKMTQLLEWAHENKKQLQFIESNYADVANKSEIQMLSEFVAISQRSFLDRLKYNKRRQVHRSSLVHDKALSLLIMLKKI